MKERCIICGFIVFWLVQPDQVFVKKTGPLGKDFHRRGVIVEDDQDCALAKVANLEVLNRAPHAFEGSH